LQAPGAIELSGLCDTERSRALARFEIIRPFLEDGVPSVEQRAGDEIIVKDENGRNHVFNPKQRDGFDVGLSRPIGVAVAERLLIRANLKDENLYNGEIVEVSAIRAMVL
jgi:hypothetical protein